MKIIYQTETGIAVVHPTGELSIDQVFQKDVPDQYKSTAYIVEDDIIPADRTFRDAWQLDYTDRDGELVPAISENLDKAKAIHKARLRADRQPLLEEQDVLFMKSLESGISTTEIVAEKQRLRDITKLVDVCQSVEELKLVTINPATVDITPEPVYSAAEAIPVADPLEEAPIIE